MTTAVVIGSGPNGLAAAIRLAQAGVEVTVLEAASEFGGGLRSFESDSMIFDYCSAVHPTAQMSPFFLGSDLDQFGLEWAWPEIDLAHPLDDGSIGFAMRNLDQTLSGLGADADAWQKIVQTFDSAKLADDFFSPITRLPQHPLHFARFGLQALYPATQFAKRFSRESTKGLFAGLAAHAIHPLNRPGTAALGLLFAVSVHAHGWPVAVGGSRSIARAMVAKLESLGGRVETNHRVSERPVADIVMFDTSVREVRSILGSALPDRIHRAFMRWRPAPGSFKVDLVVEGGVGWTDERLTKAGTIHLGGTIEQIAQQESDVHRGRMPERPFVLLAQQYLADPTRSSDSKHPVWAYAHVPHGYTLDASTAILDQIERWAPEIRDRILSIRSSGPSELYAHNSNYVGGDIAGGANSLRQLIFRPRVTTNPYSLGVKGLYLCSSSTPPGGGVHGMAGFNAAESAIKDFRL